MSLDTEENAAATQPFTNLERIDVRAFLVYVAVTGEVAQDYIFLAMIRGPRQKKGALSPAQKLDRPVYGFLHTHFSHHAPSQQQITSAIKPAPMQARISSIIAPPLPEDSAIAARPVSPRRRGP